MRLAHPVTSLPLLLLASCLCACGETGGNAAAADDGDADIFLPDVARDANILPAGGWRSFTVSFSEEHVTTKTPIGSSLPVLMAGKRMRLDFDNGAFRTTHLAGAVLIDEFADPVGFGGAATVPLIMHSDRGVGAALVVHRATESGAVDLRFDSLLFDLDARALPVGGVAKGTMSFLDAGRSYYGEVTAAFGAAEDREAPRWRASSRSAFAPMALPWDARVVETSEPYEGHVTREQLFATSAVEAQPIVTSLLWGTPPRDRERGLSLLLGSWDDAAALASGGAKVHDFAGNGSVDGSLTFPGLAVPKLDAGTLDPGAVALSAVTTWGTARIEECPGIVPTASCIAFGPISMSVCAPSSIAGLATRLRGHGSTSFTIRAIAAIEGSFTGVPSNALYFASAIPGAPARIDSTTLRWPPRGVAGTFDTDWTDVTLPALGVADETGVALSLGGLGAAADGKRCVAPYGVSLTVHLREIAVSAGP